MKNIITKDDKNNVYYVASVKKLSENSSKLLFECPPKTKLTCVVIKNLNNNNNWVLTKIKGNK
jgi:hypothetical protein